MSTRQLKYRSISAEPRLVMDCTFSIPRTPDTASSTGRVMVTSIWSMGITPLSTPMMMRGKSVEGKTEVGMLKPRYPPTNARVMIRKMMDLCSRANQYDDASLDSAARNFGFGCAEFAIAEGKSLSVRRAALLRRSCDAHFHSVWQSVGAGGHHFLSRL